MTGRQLALAAAGVLVLWGALHTWQRRPLHAAPGVLAAEAPEQIDLDHPAQLQRDDVTLLTRGHFDATARGGAGHLRCAPSRAGDARGAGGAAAARRVAFTADRRRRDGT